MTNKCGLFRTTVSAMLSLEKQAILWSRNSGIKIIKENTAQRKLFQLADPYIFRVLAFVETKTGHRIQFLNDLFLKHVSIFMAINVFESGRNTTSKKKPS